ncbi:alpha/beta fold hydrolase [Erythrobacter litoralis]|uniref:AB hydrolase-1 domain-containing protein n=1 Tax=Erythrobacter litoralis (strain HTCC2594) TaxID=314225 RepID=Q2NCC3_ERYLH|nr:alpha/beta hydrolase [Erythrobacter litoralis]ABC62668.1 hypothetical protein ELI_02880 [Erythrobacter litoralis HTCC2594]
MTSTATETAWADRFWESEDGLTLHYRDYPGDDTRLPALCLHGLTRNARDSGELAARIAPQRRVLVPDMRGRGDSDYAKDSASYNPPQYVADLERLLAGQGIARFIAIGTSLGGLMTMLMAAENATRIAGAVLNDIGPVIEADGIEKIRTYVGQGRSFDTWVQAARALKDVHGEAHPTFQLEDWLAMAKRVMVLGQGGRISFDYDMAVADPFNAADSNAAPPDMWPAFEALAQAPLLLVRGDRSNLLSAASVAEMQKRAADMQVVTIADTGHAPLLTEPPALAAIDAFLERLP